jgi:hypothetical protein
MPLIGPDPDDAGNKHFSTYDPDAPFGHYDDDHDHSDGRGVRLGLGPYRPLHPFREGFTMGICLTVVVGFIIWLLYKVV